MTTLTPLTPAVRGVVRLCGAVLLLDTTFFAVLSPLLAGYADSAHLDQTQVGLLVAAYPLGMVLGVFPAGNLVSRRSPRAVLRLGMVTASVTCLGFAFAATGPQLIGFRFLQGIGAVLAWTGAMSWVSFVAPSDRRGELVGKVLGMAVIGGISGPAVGALASVLGTVPVFVGLAVVLAGIAASTVRFTAPEVATSPGWRHAVGLLRDHRLRLGLWLLALGGIGTGVISALAPLTLADLGVTALGTSAVFLAMAGGAAFSSPRVGRRTDRHGRAIVSVIVLTVATVALVLTGIASRGVGHLGLLIVLLIVTTVALEACYVPGSALIVDGTEDADSSRGEVLALANLGWALGMSAASILAGVLTTRLGAAAPYLLVAMCTAVTVPEFVAISRRSRASFARP